MNELDIRLSKQRKAVKSALLGCSVLILLLVVTGAVSLFFMRNHLWGNVFTCVVFFALIGYFSYFAIRLGSVRFAYQNIKEVATETVSFVCRKASVVALPKRHSFSASPVAVLFLGTKGERYVYALSGASPGVVSRKDIARDSEGRKITLKVYKGTNAVSKAFVGSLVDE